MGVCENGHRRGSSRGRGCGGGSGDDACWCAGRRCLVYVVVVVQTTGERVVHGARSRIVCVRLRSVASLFSSSHW